MEETQHRPRSQRRLTAALIVTIVAIGHVSHLAFAQMQAKRADSNAVSSKSPVGEKLFIANCSGCHGLDGQGGDKAPSIAGNPRLQRLSDAQIAGIALHGVPGTGMPSFQSLGEQKVHEIVAYLRVLQGKRAAPGLPGNPTRGKEIFFGKGECSACHIMNGAGGFLGPDLSAYGSTTSAKTILDAILSSDRNVPPGYQTAVLTTRDGEHIEGIIRNEDNFSIQLQTKDGSFHFFQKSDLQGVEHTSPLMPTNYRERLSSEELNDLVNYIIKSGSSQNTAHVPQEDRDDDEDDFK
jgi:cytochrome c oxidase cbb3-type subunit III